MGATDTWSRCTAGCLSVVRAHRAPRATGRRARIHLVCMVHRCLQRTLPAVSKRYAAWSALDGGNLLPSEVRNTTIMLAGRMAELERVLGELCLHKELAAVAMGGSVTFGHGIEERGFDRMRQSTWPSLLQAALSTVWNANVTMRNCAVPATSADFAALCYDSLSSLVGGWPGRKFRADRPQIFFRIMLYSPPNMDKICRKILTVTVMRVRS
jgi:hypothetical protein